MKGYLVLVALPALALAAVIGTESADASNLVRMTSVEILKEDPGTACPKGPGGDWSKFLAADGVNTTIMFDNFDAYIGQDAPDSKRERTCNYKIGISFPMDCSVETKFNIIPRGVVLLTEKTHSAVFEYSMTYNIAESPASQLQHLIMTGDKWVSPKYQDFRLLDSNTVSETIKNTNQRTVYMTVRSRFYVEDQNKKTSSAGLFSIDVGIESVKTKSGTCKV